MFFLINMSTRGITMSIRISFYSSSRTSACSGEYENTLGCALLTPGPHYDALRLRANTASPRKIFQKQEVVLHFSFLIILSPLSKAAPRLDILKRVFFFLQETPHPCGAILAHFLSSSPDFLGCFCVTQIFLALKNLDFSTNALNCESILPLS